MWWINCPKIKLAIRRSLTKKKIKQKNKTGVYKSVVVLCVLIETKNQSYSTHSRIDR